MTKRERAIAAARVARAGADGWADDFTAALEAYHAVMSEPDQPPEGKLRVRVCVAIDHRGRILWRGEGGMDDGALRHVALYHHGAPDAQVRWIEADVTPWQPPAEETVRGQEVEG